MEGGNRRPIRRREALRLAATSGAAALLAGCFGEDDGGDGGGGTGGASGSDEDDGPRELVVGTAAEFPPFELTEGSSLVGFDVALATAAIDAAEGYELGEWRYEGLFSSLPGALADGDVDVVVAALSITEPRQADLAFTEPYLDTRQAVLVADDRTPMALEELAGSTLGAQTATTGEALIETELIETGLVAPDEYASWDTYPAAVAALEQGTVDAVVVDAPAARSFAADGSASVAFLVDDRVERYGFGVRGDDAELRDALDEGLLAARESGRYDEIAAEWLSGLSDAVRENGTGGANESGNVSDD